MWFGPGLGRPTLLTLIAGLALQPPVLKVGCGGMQTLVIVGGGLVYSMGSNDEFALGREAAGAESTPGLVRMPGNAVAVDISAGRA